MKIQNITAEITISLTEENHFANRLSELGIKLPIIGLNELYKKSSSITRSAAWSPVQFEAFETTVWCNGAELKSISDAIENCGLNFLIYFTIGSVSPFSKYKQDGKIGFDGYEMYIIGVRK